MFSYIDFCFLELIFLILLIEKEYQRNENEVKELPARNYAASFIILVGVELYRHHDVDYYAERLCITANYLNKISHSTLGVSAHGYIKNGIVAEAKNLLDITEMPVNQISDTLGFKSANYFIRFFKKQTGVTPGEYRDKAQ